MTNQAPINLLFCLDKKCFDGLLITLLSAAKTTKHPLNVFLATGSFKTKKKDFFAFEKEQALFVEKVIQKYNPQSKITLLDLSEEVISIFGKSPNFHGKFSPLSMIRLLADYHPEFGDKLLYLDVDLVVTGDLYTVFSESLGDKDIGMVKDEVGSYWLGKNYCNSGVLLMDLAKLRENHHFDLVRHKINHNRYFMPDQTALNRGMKKYKKILSPRYNDQHYLHPDTVIRHYCQWIKIHSKGIGNVAEKPWNIEKFRKVYGNNVHKDILDEFLLLKEEFHKENNQK